jgi:hypothetical protein
MEVRGLCGGTDSRESARAYPSARSRRRSRDRSSVGAPRAVAGVLAIDNLDAAAGALVVFVIGSAVAVVADKGAAPVCGDTFLSRAWFR